MHCQKCNDSGFCGHGQGYDDVCSECGGQAAVIRLTPEQAEIMELVHKATYADDMDFDEGPVCPKCGSAEIQEDTYHDDQGNEDVVMLCRSCGYQPSLGEL